jgi:hypothetical protein
MIHKYFTHVPDLLLVPGAETDTLPECCGRCHLAPRAHSELALGGGDVFGVVEFGFDVGDIALREIVE